MIKLTKKDIVTAFMKEPHSISFAKIFRDYLRDLGVRKVETKDPNIRDKYIVDEWELKRWFWSFLENAVALHTQTITVNKEDLTDYDIALIVKSLKGMKVNVKVKE